LRWRAPTAMLLARKGYRVLLVDRSTFPSDIPHGHFIHRHGPRRLREWGLLDRIVATGCPPSTTITLDTGGSRLVGKDLVLDGVAAGYGPRRSALDQVLIDGAVAAGVHLREGFAVEEYVSERDRIVGIGGRDRTGGALVTERAVLTVGADGRGSRLARTVQAPEYDVTPTLTCWYFSYWSGVVASGLELYVRPERVIFAFPTNDGLFAIFIAWPVDCQRVVQADLERQFISVIDLVPDLAERVQAGPPTCRTFCADPTVPDGPWSVMPAATRIPIWRWASATPFATPNSSLRQSTKDSREHARSTQR